MADEVNEAKQDVSSLYRHAFRPLFWWFLISVLLLAWDDHRKRAARTTLSFTVTIEGKTIDSYAAYSASLGKHAVVPGGIVPIGWRTLVVTMRDAEPLRKSLFIWYGKNDAGQLDLAWSRGLLDLKIEPPARIVRLAGPHRSFSLTNSSGARTSIPVGTYKVSALFDRFSEEREFRIGRNETNRYELKFLVGAVSLGSEPVGAKFRFLSLQRTNLAFEGQTPSVLDALPAGTYKLKMWQDDYIKETEFALKDGKTNEVNIAFEYGEVKLTSEPDGAAVFEGSKELGKTPATLASLKPGNHRFRLELEGFHPADVTVDVRGKESIELKATLVSRRYTEAMENARRSAESAFPDYRRALANVEEALQAKPADDAALKLQSDLEFVIHVRAAKSYAQERNFAKALAELDAALVLKPADKEASELKKSVEQAILAREESAALARAEARKQHPEEVFTQATTRMRHAELFDMQSLSVRGTLATVRDAVRRALARSPKWEVTGDTEPDAETFQITAGLKGLLQGRRHVVVVGGQASDDEVRLCFKVWEYAFKGQVGIGTLILGPSEDDFVPVHPNYYRPQNPSLVKERREEAVREFRERLRRELQ